MEWVPTEDFLIRERYLLIRIHTGSLSIEHVHPVEWNTKAFSRVVLKSSKKELIKALVMVHISGKQSADVVEDKGNGLIVLLHGSPGTGKTLTAESVAEIAQKPLYRVTCGDIGTDAEVVEKYLESVLLVGTIWGCVVLLDEADIFLEERQPTDLARNALVSVFLRILEYYNGILILTSNRVGTFDEAFKSRVQLAIHYPALNEDGRFEIWRNFITMLKEKDVHMNFEELDRKVPVLARNELNGRQIRNLIWTAGQLARYKKEPLEFTHLEQVIEIANEFECYLKETHGQTDEEYAKAQGNRIS
jgi:AAA+ superfamily predicted ATPase